MAEKVCKIYFNDDYYLTNIKFFWGVLIYTSFLYVMLRLKYLVIYADESNDTVQKI